MHCLFKDVTKYWRAIRAHPPQKYWGPFKVTEVDVALHLYKSLYNLSKKQQFLKVIVVNNDSTMRALLQHKISNKKDRLPLDMSQSEWLVDLSNRTKVVAKSIYNVASLSKNASSCTKFDAIRFKQYFDYMLKTNRNNRIAETVRASKAIVEHPLHNYEIWDKTWCRRLKKRGGRKKGSDTIILLV